MVTKHSSYLTIDIVLNVVIEKIYPLLSREGWYGTRCVESQQVPTHR